MSDEKMGVVLPFPRVNRRDPEVTAADKSRQESTLWKDSIERFNNKVSVIADDDLRITNQPSSDDMNKKMFISMSQYYQRLAYIHYAWKIHIEDNGVTDLDGNTPEINQALGRFNYSMELVMGYLPHEWDDHVKGFSRQEKLGMKQMYRLYIPNNFKLGYSFHSLDPS